MSSEQPTSFPADPEFWYELGRPTARSRNEIEALLDRAKDLASRLRLRGNAFMAGMLMNHAIMGAWGYPDLMLACRDAAAADYATVVSSSGWCAPLALAALKKLAALSWEPGVSNWSDSAVRAQAKMLRLDLAQRLTTCFDEAPDREGFLVRGCEVTIDLDGAVRIRIPDFEVHWEAEVRTPNRAVITLPPSFDLFVLLGDYRAAQEVIDKAPDAFTTPRQQGWKAAVDGFLHPERAMESFRRASEAFAADVLPKDDEPRRPAVWTAANLDLWSPYFAARSLVAAVPREPDRAKELIATASQLFPFNRAGFQNPQAKRFGFVVGALVNLLGVGSDPNLKTLQERFSVERQVVSGTYQGDELLERFLELAREAMAGFRDDPARELLTGRLGEALRVLDRVPLVTDVPLAGHGVAAALEPQVGAEALRLAQGQVRTWIHRALQRIRDEATLHHLILRLSQAQQPPPLFAQVLHGPLEYGKDVAVLHEWEGRRVLRMYQAKIGDLDTKVWNECRPQLEAMFLVDLPDFVVPVDPSPEREGVLVFNGHVRPHAWPLVDGWLKEQVQRFGWHIELMDLDRLVRWIHDDGLISEFRAAAAELGLSDTPTATRPDQGRRSPPLPTLSLGE